MKKSLENIAYFCVFIIIIVTVWFIFSLSSPALSSPTASFGEIITVLGENSFWKALGGSLSRSLLSFVIAFLAALSLALLSTRINAVAKLLSPFVTIVRAVPTMAVVLLFIIWTNARTATVLVGLLVLFPSFYAAFLPVAKSANRELLEVCSVCGANAWQKVRYVYLPTLAPVLVETAASGISLSLKLIVSAEVLAQTAQSIGMMMQSARAYLDTSRLLALTVLTVAFCLLFENAIRLGAKPLIKNYLPA